MQKQLFTCLNKRRVALIEAVLAVEMSYTHLKIFGLLFLPMTRLCIALLRQTTVSPVFCCFPKTNARA
jgi:hypothetical protein